MILSSISTLTLLLYNFFVSSVYACLNFETKDFNASHHITGFLLESTSSALKVEGSYKVRVDETGQQLQALDRRSKDV